MELFASAASNGKPPYRNTVSLSSRQGNRVGLSFAIAFVFLASFQAQAQPRWSGPGEQGHADQIYAMAAPDAGQFPGRQLKAEIQKPDSNRPRIESIQIDGVNPEGVEKAKSVLRSKTGDRLDPQVQRADVARLYELGMFRADIEVQSISSTEGVELHYIVKPNPTVNSISVIGNKTISHGKLLGGLPVKKGEVYTIEAQNKILNDAQKLCDAHGLFDAVVHVEERPGPGNTVDIELVVDEGTRIKVKDLMLRGNRSLSALMLKLQLDNRGSFGPLTRYYNETKFRDDLEKLKAAYAAKGYLDADARRGEFIYANDRSWVNPVVDITENSRYRVGRLDVRGYSMFTRDEIMEPFRALQGEYYDLAQFKRVADHIRKLYDKEGFMSCRIEPDFHKDPVKGIVDVDLVIDEGPRMYVGEVHVVSSPPAAQGSSKFRRWYTKYSPPVREEVVAREVRLQQGGPYRRFDEVRSAERLRALGVFEDVTITDQLTEDPNVRDCLVEVKPGRTGNLIFGVGFGDMEGAFVYAKYAEHNLFGMARDLRVTTMLGSKTQGFEVSYLDRYFRGEDIAAQFDLYHRNVRRTGDVEQTNTGGMAEFTRPLSECLKESMRLRLEAINFDLDDDDDEDDDEAEDAEIHDYLAATVRYRICEDARDDPFFPTSGFLRSGSIETGFADGWLLKIEGQYSTYRQLSPDWVYAGNFSAGLQPYKAVSIGYADRFFMGGSQDLRGFRIGGAGPHSEDDDDIPLGGSTKLVSQNELRRAICDSITGVAFLDAGMMSERVLSFGSPRVSVGTGVRIKHPVFQAAVDLGVPIIKKSDDQTQLIHFALNSAF